ncbi:LolA family protein [Sphingomonas baiyangensis]|uniref:Outer membrane lipoprotein carrier protein LolA n=1 Tax=Sphingomonas baiyangensis TaxID=2572576 RepID=A0A4U1L6T7_9SPHN|nr:outer membrane lipoprotein carrier protein LolA [Sphingomonas baiyangensis]TKD52354.1 outer membrane lipoprotein carrier protein LolA [Sphingomonas baiyangensis]
MNRFALALALAGTLAAPVALAPAAVAQQGDLAAVQTHLRAVESMTAAFTQTDRAGKTLTGTLTLKKPGKIRFQYEKGVPILIVGDGKAIWFLDYSVGQRSRWPIGDSPLGVLIDPNRDITRYAKVVPGSDPRVLSVEAYDPKRPEYGRITMIFERQPSAPAGLMLQGWVALDSQGNRTTIRLADQRFNAPVSDSTFRFNDPRRGARRS